ncbi:DUF5304 family protein [Streptomyces sp. SP17BM10]|uniref:DUF5304 family protein n=1 Tax=Streptomyces sp. SP17BM10 TaxID=3002530 RepID=UPI002E7723EB|nr:DUF5304 family protein [Streptomyces sp. SP17BM10]MEE1785153.1 DUF5304 family protein [Streptomyces sp. SP17BM10]
MTSTDRTEPTDEPGNESTDGPRGAGTGGAAGGSEDAQAHPFGPELGPLVDEVRRFADAVGQKAQEAGADTLITLAGFADRLREQKPEVYGHLAAAGSGLAAAGAELLAAYRAAVAGHERRWTAGDAAATERIDLDTPDEPSTKQ